MRHFGDRYFGAHVSASGGLERSLANGQELGVNTIQIHPSPPQRWNVNPFAPGVEAKFLEARESSGVKRLFFHAIYLINMASPEDRHFNLSKKSLSNDLDLCARIAGDGVIFHSGSLKNEPDERKGLRRVADGINEIMEKYKGTAKLIIEVAAGSGAVIGDRLEELAEIYSNVEDKARVGFGLDSQHLWASGYDLKDDLSGFIKQMQSTLTIEKIYSFHLNDSKTALASRVDRHENLGQGLIGIEALTAIVNHPVFANVPFILETPALKDMATAKEEVQRLREIVSSHSK